MIHGPSVTSGTSLNRTFLKSSGGKAPGSWGSGQEMSDGIFHAVAVAVAAEEDGAASDSDPS